MSGTSAKTFRQRTELRVALALIRRGSYEIRDGLKTLTALLPGMYPAGLFIDALMGIETAADSVEGRTLKIEAECERVTKRKS